MVAAAKKAKAIHEKVGAELFQLGQIHTGAWAGQWLVTVRWADWKSYGKIHTGPHAGDLLVRVGYPNWEAYGKAQQSFAHNLAYQAIMSEVSGYLADRVVVVGIDL